MEYFPNEPLQGVCGICMCWIVEQIQLSLKLALCTRCFMCAFTEAIKDQPRNNAVIFALLSRYDIMEVRNSLHFETLSDQQSPTVSPIAVFCSFVLRPYCWARHQLEV